MDPAFVAEPDMSTPERVCGSVRRTANVDMLRPDGLLGDVTVVGSARDLATGTTDIVLGEATMTAVVDVLGERRLRSLATSPAFDDRRLLGAEVRRLRRILAELAARPPDGSLLAQLLDDLPIAALISQATLGRQGISPPTVGGAPPPPDDVCAGWVSGGSLSVARDRGTEIFRRGPTAVPLERTDDPSGWHAFGALPDAGMRRVRRIDVVPKAHGGWWVDSMFRDSVVEADGAERIVHEYGLSATVGADLVVEDVKADPRVLPSGQCPMAVASSSRIVGYPLAGVRQLVGLEFRGISTCTHLNDSLRALGDAAHLISHLADL